MRETEAPLPIRITLGFFQGSVGADCVRTRPNVRVGALL